jgi:CRISPR-associated exonuclease Cas4
MDTDDDLPISALSHLVYCERRAALVQVLGYWDENEHTVAGHIVHQRIDSGEESSTPELRVLRSLHVHSTRLRLRGVIDAVEVRIAPASPRFLIIETKRSKRKRWARDEIQLCAQAMALEEMTGEAIGEGVIFHAGSKRRRNVPLTPELRSRTEAAAKRLHQIMLRREVPPPVNDERCAGCSLRGPCQPAGGTGTLRASLRGVLE